MSTIGTTAITLTGTDFSPHKTLNTVTFGGAPCLVEDSNTTYIICTIPLTRGVAGVFSPLVTVFNKGLAEVKTSPHTVLMTIDSVTPSSGSLYGGLILTITGSGFAPFGLWNQVKLLLHNDTTSSDSEQEDTNKVHVDRTADAWDDDWLWQRGRQGDDVNNNNKSSAFTEVLCVPRTLKNRACRYSEYDSGAPCDSMLAYGHDGVRTTELSEWFDFSSSTSIECTVESLTQPLGRHSLASVNVTVVNETILVADKGELEASLERAKEGRCHVLEHCETLDEWGVVSNVMGVK